MRSDIWKRLWRLLRKARLRRVRQAQLIFFRNGQRLLTGAAVGIGGAGGDHIQRVADDVGQNDGINGGGLAVERKAAALDGGQTLADGVHLDDIRAAGKQLLRDILRLLKRHKRGLKQCGAAAGDEKQHAVLRRKPFRQRQRGLRCAHAVFVRHRVSGLKDLQAADGTLTVPVFCNDCAGRNFAAENLIGGVCHDQAAFPMAMRTTRPVQEKPVSARCTAASGWTARIALVMI